MGVVLPQSVALWEEVCYLRWALRSQKLKTGLVAQSLFLLPANVDVELSYLSSTMSSCILPC